MNRKIMQVAFDNKEWNTVAECMIDLYAEYMEGNIESSRDQYNNYLSVIHIPCWEIIKKRATEIGFESLAKDSDRVIAYRKKHGME